MENKNQIGDIKSRIDDIRRAMDISSSTFKMIYAADNFRSLFLLSGIFSLILPVIYHILLAVSGTHGQIPKLQLIIFYSAIFVCWLILIVIRTKVSMLVAKKLGVTSNLFGMVKRILSSRMWIAVVPVLLFLIAVPLKYLAAFDTPELVAYYGVVLGLTLNMIGVMINQREYSLSGAWAILSGVILLFAITFPVHIVFAVILAPMCFIFVIANSIISRKKESGNETG